MNVYPPVGEKLLVGPSALEAARGRFHAALGSARETQNALQHVAANYGQDIARDLVDALTQLEIIEELAGQEHVAVLPPEIECPICHGSGQIDDAYPVGDGTGDGVMSCLACDGEGRGAAEDLTRYIGLSFEDVAERWTGARNEL